MNEGICHDLSSFSRNNAYEYDAFHQMTRMVSGAEDWRYIYTADDERFWMYGVGGGGSIWTLRGLDAKVLREYQAHAGWSAFKDYIYRGSSLLAEADSAALGSAVRHFHLDHLGTIRAITNAAGQRIAYHIYVLAIKSEILNEMEFKRLSDLILRCFLCLLALAGALRILW
jgi:hypothetical protein